MTFKIDNFDIGLGAPCFLVAEVGINHNGDMTLAKESIAAAKDSGASAVKFQNYYTDDFIFDKSLTYTYTSAGKEVTESQYAMFKRCELTPESLGELKTYTESLGMNFHSTPTSSKGIKDLSSLGVKIFKNGSDYLTNLDVIAEMAESCELLVLATGMATISEMEDAINVATAINPNVVLLHCVSSYPTPAEDVNLLKLNSLRSVFGLPVGFSDHTEGITAALGAVAYGACWIEKHFTLSKDLEGPDHWFSSDPEEFKHLCEGVRRMEAHAGESALGPTPKEMNSREAFRLSCVAAKQLISGATLAREDIAFLRPGTGLAPKHVNFLVGRQIKSDIAQGQVIFPDQLA